MFLESCPFLLGCQICWHIIVHSILMFCFVFSFYEVSVEISPISILILFIWVHKSINVIHHINKRKVKKTHDHLKRCRKGIWQNSTSLMIKNSYQSGKRWNRSQHNKAIYNKPTVNVILNGEKLKAFLLNSGTRQGCSLSPLLFNIVLEVLAKWSDKKTKMYPNWKERNKIITICRWHNTIYRKS